MDKILAAARKIATARRGRNPLPALADDLVPADAAEGYRIQRAVHDLLLPQTGALVGYKIGCTSAVMQQYLDIPHPCGGGLFAKGVHESGAKLRFKDYVRVGVECEIAVRLARDLVPSEAPFTAEWVAEAIDAYSPAQSGSPRPARRFASHASASNGCPITARPSPRPTSRPFNLVTPVSAGRSRSRHRVIGDPRTQPALKKSSAMSVGTSRVR